MGLPRSVLCRCMRSRVRMPEDMGCLLKVGLCEGDEAAAAWARWRQLRDLDSVSWEEHKGLARIAGRLVVIDPDGAYRPRIHGLAKANWTLSQIMLQAGVPALRALVEAGIDVMLLKGCAVQMHVPRSSGPRVTSDLDVMVPRADFPRAIRVLAAEGWFGRNSVEYAAASWRFKSGQGLRRAPQGNLDIHHQPLHGDRIADDVLAAMWARSSPFSFHGVSVRLPSLADLVVCAASHAMDAMAKGERPVARFLELHDLITCDRFDAEAVAEVASQFSVTPVVVHALRHLDAVKHDRRVSEAIRHLERRPGAVMPWVRYFADALPGRPGTFMRDMLTRMCLLPRPGEREEEVVPRVRVSGRTLPGGPCLPLDDRAGSMCSRHEFTFPELLDAPRELVIAIRSGLEPGGHMRLDVSVDGDIHARLLGSVKDGCVLSFRLPPVPAGSRSLAIVALPPGDGAPRFSLAAVAIP